MTKPSAIIFAALAGLCASPALANPQTGLFEWQVSADGGATWSSSITISPGSPYRIRGVVSWTTAPGTFPESGFAACSFEQIDLIGADSSDVFGGASGPGAIPAYLTRRLITPEDWTLQAGTGASAAGLKIDNINPTSTTLGQGPERISPWDFHHDNPWVVFDLAAAAGDAKVLTISATWTRLGTPPTNLFFVYTTSSGTSQKPVQEATVTGAHVWIRPNASCVADFNGDGLVDFSDYLEFLSFFDTQDFRADLNRDGLVDFSDYLEFLTAFDAGC